MTKAEKARDDLQAVLTKIASWPPPFDDLGRRLHEIVVGANPDLQARLWYGMPGYATSGPVLCFFTHEERLSFGLTEKAHLALDDAADDLLIQSSWIVEGLDDATEARLKSIVVDATV